MAVRIDLDGDAADAIVVVVVNGKIFLDYQHLHITELLRIESTCASLSGGHESCATQLPPRKSLCHLEVLYLFRPDAEGPEGHDEGVERLEFNRRMVVGHWHLLSVCWLDCATVRCGVGFQDPVFCLQNILRCRRG